MTKTIPAVRYYDETGKPVVVTFKFGGLKSAVLFLNRCILDYGRVDAKLIRVPNAPFQN